MRKRFALSTVTYAEEFTGYCAPPFAMVGQREQQVLTTAWTRETCAAHKE
jgi:hypothetical protein